VTESDWATSTGPQAMLSFLRDRGPVSERKLRLFAVACCHRMTRRLTGKAGRRALLTAERYADGLLPATRLYGAWFAARRTATVAQVRGLWEPLRTAKWAVSEVCEADVALALRAVARVAGAEVSGNDPARMSDTLSSQVVLLRDIFGDPFRPLPFHSEWRSEVVVAVGRGIYRERAWKRLPELADALENAGCADGTVLNHCRGAGPHRRGCWVVDMVLGKT
jgi:hypothetical protein